MRLLASSTNENEADINDPQKPLPPRNAVSTTVAAHQPSSHDRWPYFLPLLGADAEKRGHKLPYSFGISPGFYFGKRHIKVTDQRFILRAHHSGRWAHQNKSKKQGAELVAAPGYMGFPVFKFLCALRVHAPAYGCIYRCKPD